MLGSREISGELDIVRHISYVKTRPPDTCGRTRSLPEVAAVGLISEWTEVAALGLVSDWMEVAVVGLISEWTEVETVGLISE